MCLYVQHINIKIKKRYLGSCSNKSYDRLYIQICIYMYLYTYVIVCTTYKHQSKNATWAAAATRAMANFGMTGGFNLFSSFFLVPSSTSAPLVFAPRALWICCGALYHDAVCGSVLRWVCCMCHGVLWIKIFWSVAVCCSVLQCVAVCCSVLQCVAVCCSVLQCVAVCCSVLQCVAESVLHVSRSTLDQDLLARTSDLLQCVALCCRECVALWHWALWTKPSPHNLRNCCSVLQCVAVCCGVLQWVCCIMALRLWPKPSSHALRNRCSVLQCVAVCCSVLQCVAACCSVS